MSDQQGKPNSRRPRKGPKPEPEVAGTAAPPIPAAPPLPDLFTANLETLMAEVFDFALDSFADARAEPFERVRRRLVRQGMGLTHGYAKLLGERDRHLKTLNK